MRLLRTLFKSKHLPPSPKEANNKRLKVSEDIPIFLVKEKHKTKNFPDEKDQRLG